jgi:hypothetical protein
VREGVRKSFKIGVGPLQFSQQMIAFALNPLPFCNVTNYGSGSGQFCFRITDGRSFHDYSAAVAGCQNEALPFDTLS